MSPRRAAQAERWADGISGSVATAATVVQAATTFALSQVLGVAAQRAITDMRRVVQEQVMRLPVRYFDSTQSGILISRIMTDAEGIRNLVGTGIVQLVGSLVTAALALAALFYLNWRLTSVTIVVLLAFGGMMAIAFRRLRPLFRERGQINAEITGRLAQSLGGIHIVKAYNAHARDRSLHQSGRGFHAGAGEGYCRGGSADAGVAAVTRPEPR